MSSRIPVWLRYALLALLVAGIATGIVFLFRWNTLAGWIAVGVVAAILASIIVVVVPPLLKMYRFQKYFKQHEDQMRVLPTLMQTGRTQEALMRFEGVMKHAPDSAYIFYMRAFFLQAAGKLPEALSAANRALTMADRDPFLLPTLQQMGGQMGQPTTVAGFKEQLTELRDTLEPRVTQMRGRRERAVSKRERKKKSR